MTKTKGITRFLFFSIFGIFMFFFTVKIGAIKTIPIDHIVKRILKIPHFKPVYGLAIIFIGTLLPFYKKTWNKTRLNLVFSFFNILGLIFTIMSMFNIGPEIITQKSMGPFVLNVVVIPVVLIVPIGSIFLSFIISYGLMESIGTIMEPIMRPIFKTPGRSAIDAVASFVGSYSLALLVTNRVYKENKYTKKEAAIIATGFSTVSATFMIITLNTLGLMEYWNQYFWICLLVTFAATAITARIYPLSKMSDGYYLENVKVEKEIEKISFTERLKKAWEVGIDNAMTSEPVLKNVVSNLKDGIILALNIGSTIMSIGIISLLLAQYTNIFDVLAYIFLPLTKLLHVSEPMLLAKASTITLADMYVPAIISTKATFETRYIIAVLCISELLFFSASIPCILATEIPVKIRDIIILWFERVVISLILVVPIIKLIY
ncbi:MAG: YjiH family protein [Fusobacterium sp.]|nr:YjiH family protein [Fusobacterium sp.]